MDNLCHSLAGAALADAGLKRLTARGMSTLIIASNLPDIDVAVFATDTLAISFRRGWTHGVLALGVLPAALALLVHVVPGKSASELRLRGLLLISYIGVWLHVFMDWLNTYGVRLLMPFSDRWFYGDSLYIVEPILYVALAAGIAVGRWKAAHGWDARRGARIGVMVAAAYIASMVGANLWARSTVRSGLTRAGRPADTRFMVTPVFGNPVSREVILDVTSRYEKGFLWFEPAPHFRPAGYGVDKALDDPLARLAAETDRGRAYLRWSRFPFAIVDRTASPPRVYFSDYRYSGPGLTGSWATVEVPLPRER